MVPSTLVTAGEMRQVLRKRLRKQGGGWMEVLGSEIPPGTHTKNEMGELLPEKVGAGTGLVEAGGAVDLADASERPPVPVAPPGWRRDHDRVPRPSGAHPQPNNRSGTATVRIAAVRESRICPGWVHGSDGGVLEV